MFLGKISYHPSLCFPQFGLGDPQLYTVSSLGELCPSVSGGLSTDHPIMCTL